MKKLLSLILALLMTTLIFASCDMGGEEVSSEPILEVSSVEVSSTLSTNSLETLETSDEYTISRIFVNDCYLYLLEFVNRDKTTFGLYFENVCPGISLDSEDVYKITVSAGTGVSRIQYYNVRKKEIIASHDVVSQWEPSSLIDPSTYPKVNIYGEFDHSVAVSPEEAVKLVKAEMDVSNIEEYSFDVECRSSEGVDYYYIRAYSTEWLDDVQIMMGYTTGWYSVDATTGAVKDELFDLE